MTRNLFDSFVTCIFQATACGTYLACIGHVTATYLPHIYYVTGVTDIYLARICYVTGTYLARICRCSRPSFSSSGPLHARFLRHQLAAASVGTRLLPHQLAATSVGTRFLPHELAVASVGNSCRYIIERIIDASPDHQHHQ